MKKNKTKTKLNINFVSKNCEYMLINSGRNLIYIGLINKIKELIKAYKY